MGHRATLGASKTVAVKVLAPNLASKPEYRRMFLEEARLTMPLNNSGIVQVFEAGETDGDCYMVMEWVDGVNLAELHSFLWKKGERLSVEISMYIIGEVLRALDYAHNFCFDGASTIVHRDISPQNIMLSVAGEVKIMDFGVARFASEETTGLHVKGKLRYMPPEQLQGNSKGTAVDLFAVGAVLHEMLDGKKFRGGASDDAQLLGMIFSGETPPLSQPWLVPSQLEALRLGMLRLDWRQRLDSARAALRLLATCPGYRNASLELSEFVRACKAQRDEGLPTVPEFSRTGSLVQPSTEIMPEGQIAETSVSRRSLLALQNPPTGAELYRAASSSSALRRRGRTLAALLVGAGGLATGVLGVGYAISTMPAEAAALSDEAALHGGVLPDVPEQIASVGSLLPEVAIPITIVSSAPNEGASGPESGDPGTEPVVADALIKSASGAIAKTPVRPKPPAKADLVEVEFVPGDYYFLYLKVKGKTVALEPKATMKLPPGKITLQIRASTKDPWTKLQVTLPNHRCRVELGKPKRVKIVPLG